MTYHCIGTYDVSCAYVVCPEVEEKRMPFEPSPHRDEIIQQLRDGVPVAEVTNRFPVSKRTVERYAEALKAGKLEEPAKLPKEKSGGELSTIVQPSRGAIIFTFGEHKISLNPQHLYDAYLYYEDMALRHDIEQEFSSAIKDSMKYIWERLNKYKAESEGISITMEEG